LKNGQLQFLNECGQNNQDFTDKKNLVLVVNRIAAKESGLVANRQGGALGTTSGSESSGASAGVLESQTIERAFNVAGRETAF